MAEKNQEIIIVKRRGGHDEGHHGGAWKIAFADFMTAMMAFFLVLWIVNSTSKETRTAVARYFNPVKLSDTTPARKGLGDPKDVDPNLSGGTGKGEADKQGPEPKGAKEAKESKETKEAKEAKDPKDAKESKDAKDAKDKSKAEPGPPPAPRLGRKPGPGPMRLVDRMATFSEGEMVEDPQGVLTDIVSADEGMPVPVEGSSQEAGPPARISKGFRDPFEPITVAPDSGKILRFAARDAKDGEASQHGAAPPETRDRSAAERQGAAKLDAASAGVRAGQADGQAGKSDAQQRRDDVARDVEQQVRQAVAAQFGEIQGPAVSVKVVEDGVLISLTDSLRFEMFAIASSEPHPRLVKAMGDLALLLQKQAGRLVIRGHTDARPFRTGKSDNWRLSTARAQMAFQMLKRGGFDEKRLERLEGHGARHPKNAADPLAPENRRIELLLQI